MRYRHHSIIFLFILLLLVDAVTAKGDEKEVKVKRKKQSKKAKQEEPPVQASYPKPPLEAFSPKELGLMRSIALEYQDLPPLTEQVLIPTGIYWFGTQMVDSAGLLAAINKHGETKDVR